MLTVGRLKGAQLHRRAKFGRNRSNRGRYMAICLDFSKTATVHHLEFVMCVRNTYEGHLEVFITVQNLFGIDAVVLIICMFFDFTSLACKRLFTPQKLGFWGILPLNWEQCQRNPKSTSLRRLSHHARKSVDASDL